MDPELIQSSLESAANPDVESFWTTKVRYNSVELPRDRVCAQLELAYSWDLKQQGRSIHQISKMEFMGRKVHRSVAKKLLSLEPTGNLILI